VIDDIASDSRIFKRSAVSVEETGEATPRVWILLGNRRGDNNQMFALAEALGLPFEAKALTYNRLRHLPFLRGPRLIFLTRRARKLLTPPWPDLVIGVGYGSIPVGRYIRRQSGGRTRLVQIGNPRTDIDDLDLVITTPQYSRGPAPNVLALPFPIGNPARAARATDQERDWLRRYPHPRRLVAVGGPTRKWKIDDSMLAQVILDLQRRSADDGGSVIAVTSPRTPERTSHLLAERLTGPTDALVDEFPRFGILLKRSDEIHVTADSVSMLSEAILTGKPVSMIPIARTLRGKVSEWLHQRRWKTPSHPDLPNFWRHLEENALVGPVDSPAASQASDTVAAAVKAVRSVLEPLPNRRTRPIRIWALLGAHRGDNNQVLALAESLGLPFETKSLRYNRWRHLQPRLLGATLRSLTKSSRPSVSGDSPDLTISTGHRSVPVVQALRRRSGGRMRAVHIGYPRISPEHFDLVVATPEYPIPDHPRVMRIPLALSRAGRLEPKLPENERLADFPAPRRLVILGGPTLFWHLAEKDVLGAVSSIMADAESDGGSVWVVGSPRTPPRLLKAVKKRLAAAAVPTLFIPGEGPPSYRALLDAADAIFVTADSVAMVSDAVLTRKAVEMVPIRPTALGAAYMRVMGWVKPGQRVKPRDLRYFWAELAHSGLVGTQREAKAVPDLAAQVTDRVRQLLES
jgi:mitochondrial fission protein ELM1